jgi:outer membrane lipoprotein SlyB
MTQLRNIVTAGVLVLSFITISNGGTITGSRTGLTQSRVGTITGSRTGTITGSRTGTITGSTVGTITGSTIGSSRTVFDSFQVEFLFRLMGIVLNGGW